MSGPLFLTPLRLEAIAVGRARPRQEVVRFGMGPVAATAARARLSRELTATRPLVVLGFAGALDPELRAGDLVVAPTLCGLDSDEQFVLPEAAGVAELLGAAGLGHRLGGLCSVPRLLKGDDEREKAAATGAIACDMESLWLVPLARRHPLVVVRAAVDVVGRDVSSLATPKAAWRAFSSLVQAARALSRWAPSTVDIYPLTEAGAS